MALGLGVGMGFGKFITRGSEIVTTPVGTGWTATGTGAAIGATSIDFTAANNLAAGFHAFTTKDNTSYEVTYTISGKGTSDASTGKARVIVYGATLAHAGSTTDKLANGTYTEIITTSAAGSNTGQVRVQATGTSGTNTFSITSVSVREVVIL